MGVNYYYFGIRNFFILNNSDFCNWLNYIIVKWKNTGGSGAHAEYLDGNKIYSGLVLFNTNLAGPTTYMEELIQVLGSTSGVETRYFYDENGNMLPSGLELGKFLYSRPIGNKTPDINPEP